MAGSSRDYSVVCPSREALKAFRLGATTAETWQAIAAHLAHCTACEAAVLSTSEPVDMVVRALQAKPDPDPFDDQQREEVVKLVQAVQKESLEGLSEETSRPLPTHIGQYAILGRLNSGGMGEVYRAQHPQLKRLVALKIMRPHLLTNAQAIKRFQREVEAAGKLSHRHIVTTYDAGEHEGNSYLVMEYIDGSDLSRVVKRHGPLGESLAVACILQAARGLEYAHYRGIIHRDVKPSNLLLDEQGTVKILDMGLARFDDALNDDLTTSEAVLGTIDYMSPEQAASTHAVDARADVYALGCTLWFVLTGRRIYDGDTPMSRMLKHREAPIPSLRAARDDASPALERIYQKMVAKVPEDRYQSMADVVRELELWQANACGLSLPDANEMAMTALSEFAKKLASDEREHCGIAGQASPRPGIGPIRKKSVVGVESLVDTVAGKRLKLPAKVIVLGAALSVVLASAIFMIRDHESDVPGRPESLMGDAVQAAPAHLLAPFTVRQARATQEAWASYFHTKVEQTNTIGMTLVLIPPGEFLMGSTPEQSALGRKMAEDAKIKPDAWEWQRLAEEGPQHRVTLTKPYWLGMTEVTVRQFKRFVEATGYVSEAEQFGFGNSSAKTPDAKVTPEMKTLTWRAPSYAVTDDSPVTQVTWNDAVEFCNWLSSKEKRQPCYRRDAKSGWVLLASGIGYRLPTEAEWEYACRAGTTQQFSFGDEPAMLDNYGWFNHNSDGSPRAVGMKAANPFGLHDMHGNVWEWCQDFYAADYYSISPPVDPIGPSRGSNRVTRGGYWNYYPVDCRSAYRFRYTPLNRDDTFGFRVARVQ